MNNRLTQAYRQTPWRIQKQWIGFIVLPLALVMAVAWIYLNVSSQAADTGLEIHTLQATASTLDYQISSERSQLAFLTSNEQMKKRAEDMGFVPIESGQGIYMTIPGYQPRQTAVLAPAPGQDQVQPPLIRTDYTQSLWDVLFRDVLHMGTQQAKVQP